MRDPPHTLYSIPPLSYFLRRFPWAYIFITYGSVQSQFDLEEKLLRSSSHNKIPKSFSSVCWLAQIVAQLQVEAQDIHRWGHRGKRKETCVWMSSINVNWNVVKLVPSTRTVVTLLGHEQVFRYSKLQTCPLVILYSISANSPSKQQGGRHIVIGASGSVDRVITLGGGGGGVGNRRPGSYIHSGKLT